MSSPLVLLVFLISVILDVTRALRYSSLACKDGCDSVIEKAYEMMDNLFQAVPPDELKMRLPGGSKLVSGFSSQLLRDVPVGPELLDESLALTRDNMKDIYDASAYTSNGMVSSGWQDSSKWSQFVHPQAYFIIVKKSPSSSNRFLRKRNENAIVSDEVVDPDVLALMHIRFTPGNDEMTHVLYIYELQLHESVQGKGLGHDLLDYAKQISTATNMDGVLLTVQKANPRAHNFYTKCGFTPSGDIGNSFELKWTPN